MKRWRQRMGLLLILTVIQLLMSVLEFVKSSGEIWLDFLMQCGWKSYPSH